MKSYFRNYKEVLFFVVLILPLVFAGLILLYNDFTNWAITSFILSVFGILLLYYFRKEQLNELNKIYTRLFSVSVSLQLESKQKSLQSQNKIFKIGDLEKTIQQLEAAIDLTSAEFSERHHQLKKKQIEVLRQNHELSAAYGALKESRERYEKLVQNLEEEYFFYGLDLHGNIMYASPSVWNILGYKVSEFKLNYSSWLTNNSINKNARAVTEKSLMGINGPKYLAEVLDSQKDIHILEITEIPIFNSEEELVSVECLAHEITEKYFSEELIREQEEKYRQVFNSASDFIFMYSVDKHGNRGHFIEANDYTLTTLGYTNDELTQIGPNDLIVEEDWKEVNEPKPKEKYERVWKLKTGEELNVEISEHLIKVKNKFAYIAVARDITERKKTIDEIQFMNEELINQKENLEALVDNLTQAQEQLVQSEKMAALGQLIAGVAHEINTPLGAIKASVGNLSDSLDSALAHLPSLFKSQSQVNLELFIKVFEKGRVKKAELSSREKREKKRTIRKELKEKGVESSEMIADLLSYLGISEDYTDLVDLLKQENAIEILKNVRDFISLMKNTNTIYIASEKASKVVFALKKYAHRDSLGEKVPTDIIDGIETVLTLYDNQLKQGVTVKREYEKLPLVMCYQDEINQVWTNLIQNSLHAMKHGGTLTLEAKVDEQNITVRVIDTGEGIEPNIVGNIFEPFFTTKKQGEGSGLGLDIVKKIIDKHNGSISVQSELGEGTTFEIIIPLM